MDHAVETIIEFFGKLNEIPRCSKHEDQVSLWLKMWAESRAFEVRTDKTGNMVIRVPASKGYEKAPVVILQGHMDMVCEKRPESTHDFAKDPIILQRDGEWIHADGTSLGADNGIAIALAMAVSDDASIGHPELELLFTVDEETGLTGATRLDPDLINGKILINLDSEDEGVFIVGCAGGKHTEMKMPLSFSPVLDDDVYTRISVSGLKGGHSGIDIGKQRANAIMVLGRILSAALDVSDMRLKEMTGGSARNVIPRHASATVFVPASQKTAFIDAVSDISAVLKAEYARTDADLLIEINTLDESKDSRRAAICDDTYRVLYMMRALPEGPAEISAQSPGLVETSANPAMVSIESGIFKVVASQRSSVSSKLNAHTRKMEAVGRLAGAIVETGKGYPAWVANMDSRLLRKCKSIYEEMYGKTPDVRVMHAGLECGVIGSKCRGMDMISLGPTIENPHSPSERLNIPSISKVWELLVAVLESFKT